MHNPKVWRQIARLHSENLTQSFLATLGPRFLTLMYRAIDECDSSVLLVEQRDESVIGFVSGAESMGPIYRKILRHWPRLLLSLFPSLLSPRSVWRILEILRYSGKSTTLAGLPTYELLSIAVDQSARGQGISEHLYRDLVAHCREHNIPAFKIVVGENLTPAHRFYERMGAELAGKTEVHKGEMSFVYIQQVREALP